MDRDFVLPIIGWVLLIFWSFFTFLQLRAGLYSAPFWFCNISVALLAIGCFQRSSALFSFFLAQGILFELPWVFDWIGYYVFGFSVFQLNELYSGTPLLLLILTFARHITIVPLAFILLAFFKPRSFSSRAYVWWALGTFVLMGFSYLLPYADNVNCAHRPCIPPLQFTGLSYFFIWSMLVLLLSFFSFFFIVKPLHTYIAARIEKFK